MSRTSSRGRGVRSVTLCPSWGTLSMGGSIWTRQNGFCGCWWVDLKELVRTFGKDDIKDKLEAIEAELAAERELAMQRVCDEIAEEDGGAG